ncbi:hypothetical protein [Streptomyces sp. H27-D2]|uniref:hypothetical protein n=1 Tax=Streptomyces sp. H27-D2 TaxID=3046304 RepID=UPI002DB627DA|nr:hypothetical protein [Streptomyces sp. H27-D2]MEC4019408.1 hypothetical protein [Streptomyces sp. H27-D2]
MAAPASAAEIHAKLGGAGTARTWHAKTMVEVCDSDSDNHDVAAQYYRKAHPGTKLNQWVQTGVYTCDSSKHHSHVLKLRVREQQIAGSDRYGSWAS